MAQFNCIIFHNVHMSSCLLIPFLCETQSFWLFLLWLTYRWPLQLSLYYFWPRWEDTEIKRVIAKGSNQLRGGTGQLCSWVHVSSSAWSSGITALPCEPSLSYSLRLNSQSDFVLVLGCYLLSERCHVLSQASSHITHQPPLWECPYFFLHSQPQLSALKRTQVLGNEKCCVSLKKSSTGHKKKWQPFFLMTGRLPWEAFSHCSCGNHLNRQELERHFIKILGCEEHHYLFCSACDCTTGSWSVSHVEQGLPKLLCLSFFRLKSSNHTP